MVEINNKFYISRNILATCFIKRKFFSTQLNHKTQKPNHSILHSCIYLMATHLTAVINSNLKL